MTDSQYTDRKRRAILKTIPLREGVAPDEVITRLSEAAAFCIELRKREKKAQTKTQVNQSFHRFRQALEKHMHPRARRVLDEVLGKNLLQAIDEAEGQLLENAIRTGGRRNDAAEVFAFRCIMIWDECSSGSVPRRVRKGSPLYRFVDAAMPDDVLSEDLTMPNDPSRGFGARDHVSHPLRRALNQRDIYMKLRWI